MNGAPWIAFPFRLVVVTAGICAASSMHLLNVAGVDTWLERLELDQMDFSVNTAPPDKLRLIYIGQGDTLPKVNGSFADEGARQLWRREHAHLLQALGNAPRLVAFDLNFPAPNDAKENQQASDEFAKAVREARTRVIVGAELNEQGLPQLIDSLKGAEWGLTQVGGLRLEHGQSKALIRRYVLARSQVPVGTPLVRQPAIPSLAVEMLLVDLSRPSTEPTSVALDTGKSELVLFSGSTELKRISCDIEPEIRNSGDRMPRLLATIPLHYPRTPEFVEEKYAQVLQRLSRVAADYRDKVVLLGARIEGEVAAEEGGELVVLAPKPDERAPAYGYQVHASVYSDLLLDTYPRRLRGVWQLLMLLVLGFLSGVGRKILPKSDVEVDTKILGKRNVPIGLLILTGVYAVIVWLFCRSAFIVFDVAYGALAVVASYFLCGSVLIRDRKIGRRGLNDSPG